MLNRKRKIKTNKKDKENNKSKEADTKVTNKENTMTQGEKTRHNNST